MSSSADTKVKGKSKSASAQLVEMVTIQQIRSGAGRIKSQIDTLKALKLGKLNRISVLKDTPSLRGMINAVRHLVKVI